MTLLHFSPSPGPREKVGRRRFSTDYAKKCVRRPLLARRSRGRRLRVVYGRKNAGEEAEEEAFFSGCSSLGGGDIRFLGPQADPDSMLFRTNPADLFKFAILLRSALRLRIISVQKASLVRHEHIY